MAEKVLVKLPWRSRRIALDPAVFYTRGKKKGQRKPVPALPLEIPGRASRPSITVGRRGRDEFLLDEPTTAELKALAYDLLDKYDRMAHLFTITVARHPASTPVSMKGEYQPFRAKKRGTKNSCLGWCAVTCAVPGSFSPAVARVPVGSRPPTEDEQAFYTVLRSGGVRYFAKHEVVVAADPAALYAVPVVAGVFWYLRKSKQIDGIATASWALRMALDYLSAHPDYTKRLLRQEVGYEPFPPLV